MKRKAKAEGNKGLGSIAKLLINGPTGKWGFNITKQKGTRIVKDTAEFMQLLFGNWSEVSLNILNTIVVNIRLCLYETSTNNDVYFNSKG